MNDVISALKTLGLDDKQAAVYMAGLELGSASVQELANKSGVKRTSIYNFLDELKQQGLFQEVRDGKKILLTPAAPDTLIQMSEQRTKQIEQVVPDLMSIFRQPGNKPRVQYYQGIDGLRQIYEDMLATGEHVYGFSDFEKMADAFADELPWWIPEARVERGIRFHTIAKDGPRGREVQAKDDEHLRETRLVPEVQFDTEVNIYGKKVAMLSFRRPYAGVLIEDRAIATTMKSVWQMVWQSLA